MLGSKLALLQRGRSGSRSKSQPLAPPPADAHIRGMWTAHSKYLAREVLAVPVGFATLT